MTRHLPIVRDDDMNTRTDFDARLALDGLRSELRAFTGDGVYRPDVQQHSTSQPLPEGEVREDDPQWRPGDTDPLRCDSDTGRTINVRRTLVAVRDGLDASFPADPEAPVRPRVRSECLPRRIEALRYIGFPDEEILAMLEARDSLPCPFASCEHNLRVGEGLARDSVFVPRPDIASWLMLPATCAADEAERSDRDGVQPTLEVVAAYMGVTRERVRQIEMKATAAMAKAFGVSVKWMRKVLKEPDGRALAHDTEVQRRRAKQTAQWNDARRDVQTKRSKRQRERVDAKRRRAMLKELQALRGSAG